PIQEDPQFRNALHLERPTAHPDRQWLDRHVLPSCVQGRGERPRVVAIVADDAGAGTEATRQIEIRLTIGFAPTLSDSPQPVGSPDAPVGTFTADRPRMRSPEVLRKPALTAI